MTQTHAEKYLEYVQKHFGTQSGYDMKKIQSKLKLNNSENESSEIQTLKKYFTKKQLKSLKKAIDKHKTKKLILPTKYEVEKPYSLLMNLKNDIDYGLTNLRFEKDGEYVEINKLDLNTKKPVFGTIFSSSVNAFSIKVPNVDDYLVVFDAELFVYCLLLGKIIASSIPIKKFKRGKILEFSTKKEDIIKKIKNTPEIRKRFREFLLNVLIRGSPGKSPQYHLDEPGKFLLPSLTSSMELFVMGHEYGHIFKRHSENALTIQAKIGPITIQKIQHLWKNEFEADWYGFVLMLSAMKKRKWDHYHSFWGPELLFSGLEIIQKSICIIQYGHENYSWKCCKSNGKFDDHPPPEKRRQKLRKHMKSKYGNNAIDLCFVVETILEFLWNDAKPGLLKFHQNNIPLHKKWIK